MYQMHSPIYSRPIRNNNCQQLRWFRLVVSYVVFVLSSHKCVAFSFLSPHTTACMNRGCSQRQGTLHCCNDSLQDEGQINVLGTPLQACCCEVRDSGVATGYYRNGFCSLKNDVGDDRGVHALCAICDEDFLSFSKLVNNNLSDPIPAVSFPGLQPGDKWCICVGRWLQARKLGRAPKLCLQACHERVLNYIPLDVLMEYASDFEEASRIREDLKSKRSSLERMLQGVFE